MTHSTPTPTRSPLAQDAHQPPRHDLYAGIHKALRHFMLDTLLQVGTLDVRDPDETALVLAQLDALLLQCERHIAHENAFIHPALEARWHGASSLVADQHEEHLEGIGALRTLVRQLRDAPVAARMGAALALYRQLALFVADNFQHMHHEEIAHNRALWASYSDVELEALHDRLVASIPPGEMFATARWLIPALNPVERAGMLNGVRAKAPAPAFDALVAHVRPHLDATAWSRLAPAIGADAQAA